MDMLRLRDVESLVRNDIKLFLKMQLADIVKIEATATSREVCRAHAISMLSASARKWPDSSSMLQRS